MVVCRYFLQGTCRFGNNCRYEHSYREYYGNERTPSDRYEGTPVNRYDGSPTNRYDGSPANRYRGNYESHFKYQDKYNFPNQTTSPGSFDVREITQMVINELAQSEKGGQWPLSCFAPFKEKPCYPGLEDYSPEELRWLMYQAVKSGTVESCKRQIEQLYQSYKTKREQIFHPSQEVYATIERLFKGEDSREDSLSRNFSFKLSSHEQGQSNSQSNVFSSSHTNTPAFVNSFGNANSPSLFGGSQQPSMFTASVPATNIFGNATSFSQNAFGAQVERASVTSTSLATRQQQLSFSNSPFSSVAASAQPVNETMSVETEQLYSHLQDLTEAEKEAFRAQTFTMGYVPTKPPPKEYIFV